MSDQASTEEESAHDTKASVGQASDEKRRPRRESSGESTRRSSSAESRSSSAEPRSSSAESSSGTRPTRSKTKETKSGSAGDRVSAVQAVKKAVEQFSTLTGRAPESVVGTKWEEDHWALRLEVVESRRIPDTADLLAEYDVELDAQGELLAYSRRDRYVRGRPTE
ncbi:MAG: gas vesicle protein [Kocuria sp.]|nr:gas vesicle protein [Kocuria sp.]